MPTITPKSPFALIDSISSIFVFSDSINTFGGFAWLYPKPGFVIMIEVTIPDVASEIADAKL